MSGGGGHTAKRVAMRRRDPTSACYVKPGMKRKRKPPRKTGILNGIRTVCAFCPALAQCDKSVHHRGLIECEKQ